MQIKFKFILKHSLIVLLIILLELFCVSKIFNIAVLEKTLSIGFYFVLIFPVILIYTIFILLQKLVFNRFSLRQANKFQSKLILLFSLVALIPIVPLTILTNNLLNKSLTIWLTKSLSDSLESGLNLVTNVLDERKEYVSYYLRYLASNKVIKYSLIFEKDNKNYEIAIGGLAKNFKLDSIMILNNKYKMLYQYQQNIPISYILTKELINNYKKNIEFNEMESTGNKDYLIGYSPVYEFSANGTNRNFIGGLILVKLLPKNFSDMANKIANSLQSVKQMELYKQPIVKGLTTMFIITITLIVFLIAIIVSYFLSKNVTEPIKILLAGTKRVASGDLNFKINYNAKDEIKLLINAFNHMTQELLASKEAVKHSKHLNAWIDMAQRIANSLKAPLLPIKNSLEKLKRNNIINDQNNGISQELNIINDEINKLTNLINKFVDFEEIPKLDLHIKNLNHFIIDTLNVYSDIKNIKFKTKLEKDLPLLNLDEMKMKECIINLINNSIDALGKKQNALIQIKTYTKNNIFGNFVYLEIEDNGVGISKENLDKIFEPYFTTKKNSSGLGLSIAEKIITEHKGQIKCISKEGESSKFIIELPV